MGLEFFFAHVHFLCKVYLFLCEFIYCLYAWCTYAFRERICIYMTYTYIHVHDIYILYIYILQIPCSSMCEGSCIWSPTL